MTTHTENHTDSNEYIPETYIPAASSHGTAELWKTFWILLGITIVDFIIYFTMPASMLRNIIFIVFGLVKAFYIVGTFMHLKHEKTGLRRAIVWTTVFLICYLAALILIEGDYIGDVMSDYTRWSY